MNHSKCFTFIFLTLLVASPLCAQGIPGVDSNKCLAGKSKCVNKRIAGLLKCRERCQKKPDNCGQAQIDCEQNVLDKFDGGAIPAKGCFAKLEAKDDPAKPQSVCTTTGDTAAVETEVDTAVASLLGRLEGAPAPTCGDGVVNVVGEQCDGADLNGASCSFFGHDVGLLACDGFCNFDTSPCTECISLDGACWFLADPYQNCDDACAEVGLVYATATNTYAGSDGTNGNCFDVLEALGAGAGAVADLACAPTNGVGCQVAGGSRSRCVSPTTTATATTASQRVCACE